LATVHEAQAYKDPGTPEEQSRRQFLANATIGIGGVIGLVLTIPCLVSTVPESIVSGNTGGGTWTPLSEAEYKQLEASTDTPVRLNISFKAADGYLESDVNQSVWGVKLTPEQTQKFQADRPDIFKRPGGEIKYPAVVMNFVIFSSLCPHLGCAYTWDAGLKKFLCPCHGSQFTIEGEHLAGPAPRGLDPLPFREANGKAEVTWIRYKAQVPDRVILSYT